MSYEIRDIDTGYERPETMFSGAMSPDLISLTRCTTVHQRSRRSMARCSYPLL